MEFWLTKNDWRPGIGHADLCVFFLAIFDYCEAGRCDSRLEFAARICQEIGELASGAASCK